MLLDYSRSQELEELKYYHQGAVQELHWENQGSLRKLKETAEQFEWLCEQQRNWMCCVKRFTPPRHSHPPVHNNLLLEQLDTTENMHKTSCGSDPQELRNDDAMKGAPFHAPHGSA